MVKADLNLSDELVDKIKAYQAKDERISDRRANFLATEGVRFAKFFIDRFMEMRRGENEDEIREKLLKKKFNDEEITDWFKYKTYFFEQRKNNPDLEFDSKYSKIVRAYNLILESRIKTKNKKSKS